jgi:hypothetical protein
MNSAVSSNLQEHLALADATDDFRRCVQRV